MDKLEKLLNGWGRAQLGINLCNAMEAVVEAKKVCIVIEDEARRNKLCEIMTMLTEMNTELMEELNNKYPLD